MKKAIIPVRMTASIIIPEWETHLFLRQEIFHFVLVDDLLLKSVGAGLWAAYSLDHFCIVL